MPNPWDAFRSLMPQATLAVGTALTVYADDTVALQIPNGTIRVLRGGVDIATGARYFYRNGRIEGAAPAHPVVDVTIY